MMFPEESENDALELEKFKLTILFWTTWGFPDKNVILEMPFLSVVSALLE